MPEKDDTAPVKRREAVSATGSASAFKLSDAASRSIADLLKPQQSFYDLLKANSALTASASAFKLNDAASRSLADLVSGEPRTITTGALFSGVSGSMPVDTGNYAPIFKNASTAAKLELYQQEIKELRAEVQRLERGAATAEETNAAMLKLQQRLSFGFVLPRIHPNAAELVLQGGELADAFMSAELCDAYVLAIDIRKSTELMRLAKSPKDFVSFMGALCTAFESAIKDNFGVVEKFTGDGLLAFFPRFLAGPDAGYFALRAAEKCHEEFEKTYLAHRSAFRTVILNTGLGAGIDSGKIHLANMSGAVAIVGEPVVFACRLSGGPAGSTLVNQQAYDELRHRYDDKLDVEQHTVPLKHDGDVLAYGIDFRAREYSPEVPKWTKRTAT